jgi:hypothetical protein
MAAPPGLPLSEGFDDQSLQDVSRTTASWSVDPGELTLAPAEGRFGAFSSSTLTGQDISTQANRTQAGVLADLDGDGHLDLITGNTFQSNRVYFGNGTADPFNGLNGIQLSAEITNTNAIVVGDLDRDGTVDVVVGNFNDPETNRVFLNNGTNDPFAGVEGTDVSPDFLRTRSLVLGDVNGDGFLDLVAGNQAHENRLYINDGTGGFDAGTDITADENLTWQIVLEDFNSDGHLDIAVGNFDGQKNKIYLNDGSGGFPSGTNLTADGHETYGLAAGDVNGDGHIDLVAGNQDEVNRLYLNNGTSDPFAGVTGSDISSDTDKTYHIDLLDADGDGDLDMVVANGGAILGGPGERNRLYINNGTNDPFANVQIIDLTNEEGDSRVLLVGDVDSDGDPDLLAMNFLEINRLYINQGNVDPFTGSKGVNLFANTHDTSSLAVGDVDGDGDLDVVTGNEFDVNRVYFNAGTDTPWGAGSSESTISLDATRTTAIALGDVDGNGTLDVVAGTFIGFNRLYLNDGSGVFGDGLGGTTGTNVTTDEATWTRSLVLADMDGDLDLDIIEGNQSRINKLYVNDGFGSFTLKGDIGTAPNLTWTILAGDVNGDGNLDVIAVNFDTQKNRVYINNGTLDPFNGVSGYDISSDVLDTKAGALGDLNGDGHLDFVAGNSGAQTRFHLNDGTGTFSAGLDVSYDNLAFWSLALGDLDGDGDLDIVAGVEGANRFYLNRGDASFEEGLDVFPNNKNTRAVVLADFDRDGALDVVAGNASSGINKFYSNNFGALDFPDLSGSDVDADADATAGLALGDLDSDGFLDLVVGNDGANRVYLSNGDDTFTLAPSALPTNSNNTQGLLLADLDNLGGPELVTVNNGTNLLYALNGPATFGAGQTLTWMPTIPARLPRDS